MKDGKTKILTVEIRDLESDKVVAKWEMKVTDMVFTVESEQGGEVDKLKLEIVRK